MDFSLTRGGLAAAAGALGAGGVLLFFAGMLVGTAAARPAEGEVAPRPAEPCAADSAARAASTAAPVPVLRDEGRALAVLERMSARGVPAVIEAEAAPDGEPVFRVRAAGVP